MPTLGEITRVGTHKAVWHACASCGKERWVTLRNGRPQSERCHPCGAKYRVSAKPDSWRNREGHPHWRGGRHVTVGGYVQVVVPLDDPMICMADDRGRIFEHRLVMARRLGRPLAPEEHVHHLNAQKQDNRIENLELASREAHAAAHHAEIRRLRARVQELERELAACKAEAP